jgi:hypothetical protein
MKPEDAMKASAFRMKLRHRWFWAAAGVVAGLLAILPPVRAAHGFYGGRFGRSFGHGQRGFYGGGYSTFGHSPYFGGFNRSYSFAPSHFYNYGWGYSPYFPNSVYYQASPFYGRPFPYGQPRIYVYPQPVCTTVYPYPYATPPYINVYVGPADLSDFEADDVPQQTMPPVPEDAIIKPVTPKPVEAGEAWNYLERGDYASAFNAFSSRALSTPTNSVPKLGFGLAAALSGDKITANYALRRAFETDPAAADRVPLTQATRQKLQVLAEAYRQEAQKEPENVNVRFLCAVASHFGGDDVTAKAMLGPVANRVGDPSASAANLRRSLETHLELSQAPN